MLRQVDKKLKILFVDIVDQKFDALSIGGILDKVNG